MLRLRLLQWVSPTLPVSAYVYSRGLEHAVEAGWVRDEPSAGQWIPGLLEEPVPGLDVAVLGRLYRAWQEEDVQVVVAWCRYVQASREAAERLQEGRATGQALARLLADRGVAAAGPRARTVRRPSIRRPVPWPRSPGAFRWMKRPRAISGPGANSR